MKIDTPQKTSVAWSLTLNTVKIDPFENSEYVRLFPIRKYFKDRMVVGQEWLINGNRYIIISVVDEHEGEDEFGTYYSINVVFRRNDLIYNFKKFIVGDAIAITYEPQKKDTGD